MYNTTQACEEVGTRVQHSNAYVITLACLARTMQFAIYLCNHFKPKAKKKIVIAACYEQINSKQCMLAASNAQLLRITHSYLRKFFQNTIG